MNKIEVGKTYTLVSGRKIKVHSYSTYKDPVENLFYDCSDAMWRNEKGEAFPGSKRASDNEYSVDWSKYAEEN